MSKAKSFDYMVAFLMSANDKKFMVKQGDVTEFAESCLLKGFNIVGKRQFFAKNLLASEFK